MKTASSIAVTIVCLGAIAGCAAHKTNPTPPPQAQAPVGPMSNMAHIPAMPPLPPPTPRAVILDTGKETAATTPPPHPHRTTRRKPSPAAAPSSSTIAAATQSADKPAQGLQTQAANNTPSDTSPIGELSSGGESSGAQGRHDTEQLISSTETGLNNIKRSLSTDEQLTATQIKNFLTKAKQSLTDNDLAAAQTLATKAKVLLDELTKK